LPGIQIGETGIKSIWTKTVTLFGFASLSFKVGILRFKYD